MEAETEMEAETRNSSNSGPSELSFRHQRRCTAGFLVNHCGISAADAARTVGFSKARDARFWADTLDKTGHVLDNGAARGPARIISDDEAVKLGEALEKDKKGRGVKRVAAQLVHE